ncbi:TonB-dependent receptor [Niveispirillum fermenti]|uniref:TonB-dependent receptor n=1 Tax=Niveispirillum fermenti TaxID=1233113 RepID=UPI003A89763A
MSREGIRSRRLLGASVLALSCVAMPAAAQDAGGRQAGDVLSEIIVTAQRRAENKQDVPVTVTVLGGDFIRDARIQSVQDIVARTPGFGFDTYPASEPRLSVRGIGSSARGAGGDPSTAIFIDEIYYGRPAAIIFETYDVQRVEVLKGPQGTLFGRNVAGGAVSTVTNPADPRGFDAGAEGTYGNYDRVDLAGFVNAPIADGKGAIRVTGTLHRHDGYVDRVVNGVKDGDLDDQNAKYGRAQIYLEPSDTLRLDVKADYARDRAHGPGNRPVIDLGDGGLSGLLAPGTKRGENAATFNGIQDRDTWGVRGKIEKDLAFASISYLGSYRELDYESFYDFDGADPLPGRPTFDIDGGNSERTEFSSHEVQLRSLPESDLRWVVGLYAYKADTFRDSTTDLRVAGDVAVSDYVVQDATTDSKAIYADVTVPVTDTINIFGGARYTWDKKRLSGRGETNDPGTFFTVGDPDEDGDPSGFYEAAARNSWGAFTWRAGADWHPTSDIMLYASVARGFKSGGYQDTPTDSADVRAGINPEYATNFEIGQRGTFLDRRLIWNNSVYFTRYTDLQTRMLTGFGYRADNASAEIYGLESELTWRMGNGFALAGSYAYTHTRYTKFITVENGANVDYAGNRLTRVPDHKVTLTPSYTHDLESGATLELAADYTYESRIYDDHNNKPPAIREPTHFIDARMIYTTPDGNWSVSLWGKNLTNEKTATYQAVFGGVMFAAYNPPTTYGATVRWSY